MQKDTQQYHQDHIPTQKVKAQLLSVMAHMQKDQEPQQEVVHHIQKEKVQQQL